MGSVKLLKSDKNRLFFHEIFRLDSSNVLRTIYNSRVIFHLN